MAQYKFVAVDVKAEIEAFENAPLVVVAAYQQASAARFWEKVRRGEKLNGHYREAKKLYSPRKNKETEV